jgi:hypothetical protein
MQVAPCHYEASERKSAVHHWLLSKVWSEIMTNRIASAALIFLLLAVCAIPLAAQETASYLVNWAPNPEPSVAGYIVFRSLNSGDTNPAPIDTANANTFSYVDSGLQKGIPYYYWIKAMNATGETSNYSNPVSGLTIPQNAADPLDNLCRVTQKTKVGVSSYNIGWSTAAATIGFVQFDLDQTLDSLSGWDNDQYSIQHSALIERLLAPRTYFVRAVSYDANNNMFVSAVDTFFIDNEDPIPLATPRLSIYPVPYHPASGPLYLTSLPLGGSVAIIDGGGLEVYRFTVEAPDTTWNGMNAQGSRVMSGIYYAIIKDKAGAVVEKRPIMIVR